MEPTTPQPRTPLLATVSRDGTSCVAPATDIEAREGRILVTGWFGAPTVANLKRDPELTVVVPPRGDEPGREIRGRLETIDVVSVLDGFAPEREGRGMPQVERRLQIRVEQSRPIARPSASP